MSLLANIGRLFLLRIGSQAGLLFLIIYLTRFLPPGILGEYFYFESLLGMLSIFAAFGIGGATEKFVSEGSDQDEWYSSGIGLLIFTTSIAFIIFIIIHRLYEDLLRPEYVPLFLIALMGRQLVTYFRHMFRAEFRAAMDGVLDALRNIVFIAVAILLVHFDFGSLGVILGAIIGRIVVIPFAVSSLDQSFTVPDIGKTLQLFQFAKYYIITVVGSKIFHFADVVFIGLLLTKADVGRYEVAWRLIFAAIMLNGVIAGTAFAYISQSSTINDMEKVSNILEDSLKYALIIPFGCAGGAAIIGSDIIQLLFTSSYVENRFLILILAIGFVFQPFYFLFSRSLVAIDKPRQSFYGTLLGVFSNIFLNIILIQIFGVIGAAVATSSSFAIASVTFYYILQKYVTISFPHKRLSIQLISSIVMSSILWIIYFYTNSLSSALTLMIFILGIVIYLGGLLVAKTTRGDLLKLFKETSL